MNIGHLLPKRNVSLFPYRCKLISGTATIGTGCLTAAYKPPSCSVCQEGVGAELVFDKCYSKLRVMIFFNDFTVHVNVNTFCQ